MGRGGDEELLEEEIAADGEAVFEETIKKIVRNPKSATPLKHKSFPHDTKNFQKILSALSEDGARQLDQYLRAHFGCGLADIASGKVSATIAGVSEENGRVYVSMLRDWRGRKRASYAAQGGMGRSVSKEFIFDGGAFVIENGQITEQYYAIHHELEFARREKVGEHKMIVLDGKISQRVLDKAHDRMTRRLWHLYHGQDNSAEFNRRDRYWS